MQQIKAPAIGIFAGIAAGLMALAATRSGLFMLAMLFVSPASIYLAGLGWGSLAGVLAAAVGAAIAFLVFSPDGAVAVTALMFVPAAWASHLANLARPSETGPGLDWFPLSGILLRLMAALFAGFVAAGVAAGYDAAVLGQRLARLYAEMAQQGGATIQPAEIQTALRLQMALFPTVIPAIWLLLHVLVMHVSAAVTARSGVLARPAEDIAATLALPPAVAFVAVAGIAGMAVLESPGYEIAAVATGVCVGGLGLVGLAQIHFASRGRPGRGLILFLTYAAIAMFGFLVLFLAAIGAMRAFRGPPGQPPAGGGAGTA